MSGILSVSGTQIVDKDGKEVILRGAGLGGWMNMENFISGYPGCEFQIRDALEEAIGPKKSALFFDKFLEYFFQEKDAEFFKSLGLNCIRIAFNYKHFEGSSKQRASSILIELSIYAPSTVFTRFLIYTLHPEGRTEANIFSSSLDTLN